MHLSEQCLYIIMYNHILGWNGNELSNTVHVSMFVFKSRCANS